MAAISGYPVALFQNCEHPETIRKIAQTLSNMQPSHLLYHDLRAYWMYLFANYGVHFIREHDNNKKTPEDLGLTYITPNSLRAAGVTLSESEERYLFDSTYKPTFTVAKDIENSGSNFYGPNMTSKLYETLPLDRRNIINAYHVNLGNEVQTLTYSASSEGICNEFLRQSLNWVKKALDLVRDHRSNGGTDFDNHTEQSLSHLVDFLNSGDEEDFKAHSREWLQMNNPRVEYTYGFIEYYEDPMSHIGTFQADVTLKSLDLSALLQLLPGFERRFPFPKEWKRHDMSKLPNAATAHKLTAIGGLGPGLTTIAYCLPNYDSMRSELGSKQVMYTLPNMSELDRKRAIFMTEKQRNFFDQFSEQEQLNLDTMAYDLMVTLHETIGHASGALVDGLSNEIRLERLGKWGNGLEEMRAEIIALYTGLTFFDEIAATGIMGDWPTRVNKEVLMELLVRKIAGDGWRRWKALPEDETTITQAHALADTGIMYYLIDHSGGAMQLREETIEFKGEQMSVLRLDIHSIHRVMEVVEQMAYEVQKLSSTAVPEEVENFMQRYAANTRNIRFGKIVRNMFDVSLRGTQMWMKIHPEFTPHYDHEGHLADVSLSIPDDPVEASLRLFRLSLENSSGIKRRRRYSQRLADNRRRKLRQEIINTHYC
jgi:hypothetical protein